MRTRISVAIFAALVGCGSSNNVTCGDGTTLVDGTCELGSGGSGGSGTGDTCGSGTTLQGTTCVATGGGDASAPTISMITPSDTGVSGLTPFEIDGTGFAGDNVTSLTVFFGDTTNMNCQAPVIVATATTIAGQIPPFCDINVTVSVTTNLGTATTPFHYDAIFAADGDGGGNFGNVGGELWVIDPFTTYAYDFGPLMDAAEDTQYGISGLSFDSTGKLWGVTTGDSEGDVDETSQLVTIDPTTPDISTVTVIGDVTDADGNFYSVSDIKLINGTLYGWAYITDGEGPYSQAMITIDMTSGAATVLGTPAADSFGGGGFAVDGSNVMWLAANGAGVDDAVLPTSGELDTVDPTSGAVTASANTLDWPYGAPIDAMEYFASAQVMLAVVDNGTYGALDALINETTASQFGETLAVVDTSTGDIEPAFELPAYPTLQSAVDGIAVPSSPTATLQIAKKFATAKPIALKPATRPTKRAVSAPGASRAKLPRHGHYL